MVPDAELVKAVVAGDQSMFAELVERYERTVRSVAMNVLADHHAAQDAAQETFVVAYRKLGGLRNGRAFGPWLLRIAHRQATRMARQRPRASQLGTLPDVPTGKRDGRLDEPSRRLLAEVMRLPEHERQVLIHKHFDGHSANAIAGMTGRPIGTVTKQLSRAYARLRRRLTDLQ